MSQQEKRECKVSTQDISGVRSVEYRKPSAESVFRSCNPFRPRIQQMSEVRWQNLH